MLSLFYLRGNAGVTLRTDKLSEKAVLIWDTDKAILLRQRREFSGLETKRPKKSIPLSGHESAHLQCRQLRVLPYITFNPVLIDFLSPDSIVLDPQLIAYLIK
jgi:hypothetical protein